MLLKGFKLRKSYMATLEIVLQQKKWIQIDLKKTKSYDFQ